MQQIDKIGSFYLGKISKDDNKEIEHVYYDAKDLTTHAVIIGMTGSGKTGLGISLIEEALIDGVPVIAIDPKGDIGNLLLTFPDMKTDDFIPYIDKKTAERKAISKEELAKEKRDTWEKGIIESGQDISRIKDLKESADMNLYTPGADFGQELALLQSMKVPTKKILGNNNLLQEHITGVVTGLLSLIGNDKNPLEKDYILLSSLFSFYWQAGQNISLESLITSIQTPPFEKIGIIDIETIYPKKERLKLALQFNSIIASPKFKNWISGAPLDAGKLFYGEGGKPQLSILNIAHLSEEERQFFVTIFLNNLLSWMRVQPGTSSLRAILYIDELFGYMPATSNPATKPLLLTLLKQARAYGIGLVLSTQNPVDLDYKGLSNIGTWFIGRLQTKQDRERVTTGLLSASGSGFTKESLFDAFNSLGKRKFLLHNVHEESPFLMSTRFVMSYLSGPLSREQISSLTKNKKSAINNIGNKSSNDIKKDDKNTKETPSNDNLHRGQPITPDVPNFLIPTKDAIDNAGNIIYKPLLIGGLGIYYENKRLDISLYKESLFTAEFNNNANTISWHDSDELPFTIEQIKRLKAHDISFSMPLPKEAMNTKNYTKWKKSLISWIKQEQHLELNFCKKLNIVRDLDEEPNEFKERVMLVAREERDQKIEDLKEKLNKKIDKLNFSLEKLAIQLEKEKDQASSKGMDALISAGTSILGMLLSKRRRTSITSIGSAIKKAKGALGEKEDIKLIKAKEENIKKELNDLEEQLTKGISEISKEYDLNSLDISTINISPKATTIDEKIFGLAWSPLPSKNLKEKTNKK